MQNSRRSNVLLYANGVLCLLILYCPILTLVIYSFNSSRGTLAWEGFTFKWFIAIFDNPSIVQAIQRSLEVATISATLATVLGVSTALGLRALPKRQLQAYEFLFMLPILVPEIVAAVGLLMTFAKVYRPILDMFGLAQSSFVSVVSGHLTFALAYVIVIIRARLSHLDPALEDAARNLGASRLQVFWWISLPQLMPAILCSFLLVFTLSLDDFYLSHFLTYGGTGFVTLPVYLFGLQARSALTPEMNAVASLMILMSLSLVGISTLVFSQWMNKKTVGQEPI